MRSVRLMIAWIVIAVWTSGCADDAGDGGGTGADTAPGDGGADSSTGDDAGSGEDAGTPDVASGDAVADAADAGPPEDTGSPGDAPLPGDVAPDGGAEDAAPDGADGGCDETSCDGANVVCGGTVVATCGEGEGCLPAVGCVDLCAAAAEVAGNVGCRFWAVDLPNASVAENLEMSLLVTNPSPIPSTVTVETADATTVATRTIPPYGMDSIALPQREVDGRLDGGPQTLTAVSAAAWRVVATAPVSVVQRSSTWPGGGGSADSSLLLPEHALGTDHVVVGWPSTLWDVGTTFGATLTIVATAPGTEVSVTVTARTLPGGPIAAAKPGDTITVVLDAGDVLNLETSQLSGSDLSGSRVVATAPVAVFTGNRATDVPAWTPACPEGLGAPDPVTWRCCPMGEDMDVATGFCSGGAQATPSLSEGKVCCGDHLQEQVPPVGLLGTSHVLAHSPRATKDGEPIADYWKVVATAPAVLGGVSDAALGEGEATVVPGTGSAVLDADVPVVVAQLLQGGQGTSLDAGHSTGDPAMVLVPPVSAWRPHTVFGVWEAEPATLVITAPNGAVPLLDGAPLAGCASEAAGADHTVHRCPVGRGVHRLAADAPVAAALCSAGSFVGSCALVGWGPMPAALDGDADGDGVADLLDACPLVAGGQADGDGDGWGDACDPDRDGDGAPDAVEDAHGTDASDPASCPQVYAVGAGGAGPGTPGDPFGSIAEAVAAACDGTTVEVGPGTFTGGVDFGGRDIHVVGTGGDATIVDLGGAQQAVLLVDGEEASIEALAVKGAALDAIIVGRDATPALSDLVVEGAGQTGLLVRDRAFATVQGIAVRDCKSFGVVVHEAGIELDGGPGYDCRIEDSGDAEAVPPTGGGLLLERSIHPSSVAGCSIVRARSGGDGSGLLVARAQAPVTVTGVDVIDAQALGYAGVAAFQASAPVELSDIRILRPRAELNLAGFMLIGDGEATISARDIVVLGAAAPAGELAGITLLGKAALSNALVGGARSRRLAGFAVIDVAPGSPVANVTIADAVVQEDLAGILCGDNTLDDGVDNLPALRDAIIWDTQDGFGVAAAYGCGPGMTHVIAPSFDAAFPDLDTDDPLFDVGPNGSWYLQQALSPAVDSGSRSAAEAGFTGETTDPAGSPDGGVVDRGYHHPAGLIRPWFVDADHDGLEDSLDVCPGVWDPDQTDADGDGVGDACEPP